MLFLLLRATKNLPLSDALKEMMAKYVGLDRPYSTGLITSGVHLP